MPRLGQNWRESSQGKISDWGFHQLARPDRYRRAENTASREFRAGWLK